MMQQYKDALGKPNEGAHAARLGPFARNDVLATVAAGALMSRFASYSVAGSVILLFYAGTVLHAMFGVDTAFIKLLKK